MEAAVIDKIAGMAEVKLHVIDGLEYSTKALHRVTPPVISNLEVFTLTGLLNLLQTDFEGVTKETHLIHVVNTASVQVLPKISDEYKQRPVAIHAQMLSGDRSYPFNRFIDQESAVIGLRSCFVKHDYKEDALDIDDLDYVITQVTNLAVADKLQVEDNGMAQTVTARSEIAPAITEQKQLKGRVKLAPYRTFREVEQPTSEFVLRVQKGLKGMPEIGLFEADGGAWKMDAIHNVRDWLKAQLDGWTIVA
jgi:hypothetical protein